MNSRCILAGVFALTVLFTAAQAQYTEVVPQWTTEDDVSFAHLLMHLVKSHS